MSDSRRIFARTARLASGGYLFLSLSLSGCAPAPEPAATPALEELHPVVRALRDLSGARTRIVWLKDMGDGTDYLARGTDLALMGLDTDDGRGERVIVPPGRNMAKPMFTVNGDRVVFSDRQGGTMHVVSWAGGEPGHLGRGFALHTWRDPETGIEWLYYARDFVDDGKILPTYEAIYRRALPPLPYHPAALWPRLRGRTRARETWRQTFVSEDSYQLSADGRFASAPFPWPEVGVHDIYARRWNRHGRGCWVAMAPDNSYLFWILDGPHRNLIMERVGVEESERWPVSISSLPTSDRYEVYHPRWSNHPRIMAVTGPYTVGEGSYRLPGGGADVQVWMGRFSEDHRSIEHWVRVTYNQQANFYPDIWVERDPTTQFAEGAPVEYILDQPGWPSSPTGLMYKWMHAAAQNEVRGAGGETQWFRPEARGRAHYAPRHKMRVVQGYFEDAHGPALPHTFSIEVLLEQAAENSASGFVIGYDPANALVLENDAWVLHWQGRSLMLSPTNGETRAHILLSVSPNEVALYVDGREAGRASLDTPFAARPAGPLYLGGHPCADAHWDGALSHIAIYNRPLSPHEAAINYQLAYVHFERYPVTPPEEVVARLVEPSAIPIPADIAPYRRALVFHTYEHVDGDRAGQRFLAAHWAILDGLALPDAERKIETLYTLRIAPFFDHPELEGERVAMDNEDLLLDQYYDRAF